MTLTNENYHSREANMEYFSASQIKALMDCPARAMAELLGTYEREPSDALLIGGFVDAHFCGTIEQFKAEHPEIFTKAGTLRSDYMRALTMCARAESDPLFMEYMQGDKQAIRTGLIAGHPFKVKMDVYRPGERIVDLKAMRDFKPMYVPEKGRVSFIEAWRYDLQLGIYQLVEGGSLPCYINGITKEPEPDIAVIQIPQAYMDASVAVMVENLDYYDAIKRGLIEPPRCERCDYCKRTKRLTRVQTIEEFEDITEVSE